MKKIISLVLALTMLCSLVAIPVSAEPDRESLLEREVQYIDILSSARAGTKTPAFRDSFKKDASLYHLTNPSVFTQNRTDTTYHEILNAMWIGFGFTQKAAFSGSNQILHYFDLTDGGYEVIETDTSMGSRAKTIDTDGVISYEKGEVEEFEVNYYKFGNYKLGPVSVEDDDATTDVFYSVNSILLGADSEGGSINSQTFEDLNVNGKYLNILLKTNTFEGDATIIPVKVDYTTGDAETFYVLTTQGSSADRLSTFVKVLPKKAEGEYTQQELVDNASNFVYLTSEKREELGITAEDIDEITFDGLAEGTSLIFPEKVAMKYCNRNKNGADARTNYIEDITLPLDADRTVSKVTITSWYAANQVDSVVAPYGERLATQKTSTYHKLTIPGYEGDNEFYASFGRTCQQRSVLLGMSVSGLNAAEKIEKINEKLEAIDVDTITRAECDALRLEIAELKAANAEILDSDFATSKLEEAEERLENEEAYQAKQELFNKREYEYVEIPFNADAFATTEEVFKYYPRDSSYSIYPTTDVEGNAITNYMSKDAMKQKSVGNRIFVIDSILGDEDGKLSGEYLNASNEKKTYSATLKINGNEKFKLQSKEADGAMNFIYNHANVDFKMGPIGGTGAHLTADGGFNAHVLPDIKDLKPYEVKGVVENPATVNILMSTDNVNGGGRAGFFPVEITYEDGTTVNKVLLSTAICPENMASFVEATGGASSTTGDGDRLAKTVIYVPKDTDISAGANITAAEKILSETNSEEVIGKAITLNDVKFPNDDLIIKGESVLFGDYNHARTNAFVNARQYCPVGYADFLQIPVEKNVTSVLLNRNISAALEWKDENGEEAVIKYEDKTKSIFTAYIPVTIEGASEDYLYFAKLGRLCHGQQEVYGVTVAGSSIQDKIDAIEARIEALSDTYVEEEAIEVVEINEAINELKAGGVVTDKDFDEALLEKLAKLVALAEEAAKQQIIKAVEEKIDALSGSFVIEEAEALKEAKAAYDEAIAKANIEEKDFDANKVAKLNNLLAQAERYEELLVGDKYETVDIDWNYVDNSQYLINAFEMSSVASIEATTDYYASISGQSYINTKSTFEHITIAEALAKEETEVDGDVDANGKPIKNFTGSSIGYSFYPTDKLQEKTGTFPAKDGKYYITAPSGSTFEIKGVTNEVGANGNNAAYLTFDETNKENSGSIYKVDFDGTTQYNSVNLLVAGVAEPVWDGSSRSTIAAQANVYYADGSSESQLILIPSVWGYVPAIAGKLKTQDKITGINQQHYYVDADPSVNGLCSKDKFNWVPSNVKAEVFDFGSYMTTANKNTVEERHNFKEMTNHAGTLASVSVDTKGKAVDYVEITYAENKVLEAAGAFVAAKNGDTHSYWLPISNEDVIELLGEDKAGVLKNNAAAKASECDFYLKIQRNAAYNGRGGMAVLFSASAEKKYSNLLAYIEEATAAMESITENSKLEEVFAANEIFEKALAQEGIEESDFDAALVAKFKALIQTVKEKTDVKGSLEVKYFENSATTVNVKLTNLAELAGKNFAVLLTYLDEEGKVVGSKTFTGVSTAEKEQTVTFEDENAPAGAVEVKAYLWKALGSLKPLGEAVVAKKASYAVDRFFDIEEGEFKEDATGDLNILFLGDSLTEGSSTYEIDGENADRPDHWTNVIAMYMKDNLPNMKVNVLNGGIGGTTTSFQAPIIDGYALGCEPDIVFIQNVNNYNSSSTKASVESVETIVRSLLKLKKVPTIIYYHAYSPYTPADTGVTYPVSVQTNRPNEVQMKHRDDIDALLAEYNIASLDYISYFLDLTKDCTDEVMTEYYRENNVHPKAAGYRLMGTYATAEFSIDPSAYFVRNALKAEANSAKADDVYKVTYPNDSRFAYKNFTVLDKLEDAKVSDINPRQYAFPFYGNVAQARVGGAEITFETTAKELSIYYVNPTSKNRTNKVKIYVDGEFYKEAAGANPYASNYDNIKITDLDGAKHTIKLVTDEPSQHESGSTLDIFNFLFLAEKQ